MRKIFLILLFTFVFFIGFASAWADNSSLIQNVNGCNLLNTSNATYTLTSSVSSTDTCFTISADNITLDCNYYTINYSSGGTGYGVYVFGRDNITIKNCNIFDGNWTSTETSRYAIRLSSTNNSMLLNNFVNTSNHPGIALYKSHFNNLTNNTATSNSSNGIYLYTNSTNNLFTNNTATSNTSRGIDLGSNSNNNIFTNNNVTASGSSGYAIFISSSSNNTFTNNTATSNLGVGIYLYTNTNNSVFINNTATSDSSYGIYVYSSLNNTFINTTGISNTSIGIYLESSSNNNFINNKGTSNTSRGILIIANSNDNILTNNIGTSYANGTTGGSGPGIYMSSSSNNTLTNNIGINYNGDSGIALSNNANNNTLINNTGIGNSSYGIYVNAALNNTLISNTGMSNTSIGITIESGSNLNNLIFNTGISNTSHGIRLYFSSNNTLTSNIGTSNTSQGIRITTISNDNVFTNNTGISYSGSSGYGIYITGCTNNTFTNNTGINYGGSYGLYINTNANDSIFINNTGIANSSFGIRLDTCSNNTLINNTATSNTNIGIYISSSSNNTLISTNGASNTNVGIYLDSSNNNTLTSSIGTSNISYGIYIKSSSNNILTSNTGTSNTSYGIYIYSASNNNILTNNTGTSRSGNGIRVELSSSNNLTNNTGRSSNVGIFIYLSLNNTLTKNNATAVWGYYIQNSNYTTISDCVYTSGSSYDVYIEPSNFSIENTFINCSYNISKELVNGDNNYLIRKWYYQAYVNYTNSTEASDANIIAYNSSGVIQFTSQTNSSGWIQRQEVTEYVNTGGTRSYYNNYTIFANKSGTSNLTKIYNLTITQNKVNDIFTLDEEETGLQCGDSLNVPGQTYTLTGNVSSTGICFNITAENITLDCNNFWINYSIGGAADTYGVYSNQFNTTVKNCNIADGNWTSLVTTRYGIYLDSSISNILLDNYVTTSSSKSIYLRNTNFSNLTSNTAISDELEAFFIVNSFNNDLFFNTGESNPSKASITNYCRGFYLESSPNNNLVSNTGMGWGEESYSGNSDGFFIYLSNNCTLINNTGITTRDAIILYSSDNCNLINNTGTTDTGVGIYLYLSSNNTLINNTGTSDRITIFGSNDGYGIWIGDYSHNNLLISTTAIANDGNGIGIASSSNNTLINTTAISFNSTNIWYPALLLWQADNNTISDCVNVSGTLTDVYSVRIGGEGSVENTFINCSYNTSKEVVDDLEDGPTNYLIRKWYYQAYVNFSNGTPVYDVNVTAYNTSGEIQFTTQTWVTGLIDRQEVTGYINSGGTRTYYNNYTINASLTGYVTDSNIFNFTTQQNKMDDWFTLDGLDLTSPTFTSIPVNSSLFYRNESLLVIFVATDETGFGYYSVNDTRFSINQSGFLSNATILGVGNYELNVTINDTSGNINWTRYTVQVNKSQENCRVLFNATSPLTYPKTFLAWANCTSNFTLYRNGTTISNNSEQSLASGAYNFSFLRTDTANYTNNYNETQFRIIVDTVSPTYTSVSHSSTLVDQTSKFSVNITDETDLHPNGRYIFSTNNTGNWMNDSAINFTATPSWANLTKTLNSTVGTIVGYMWYFNDTNGNANSTRIYTLITTEESPEEDDKGGGSGGSGEEDEVPTFRPTYKQIQNGYEAFLREGYRVIINLSANGTYTTDIVDVNWFTGKVDFFINDTNYSAELNKTTKLNLNQDNYYDLQVSVIQITMGNGTRMSFKETYEEIPAWLREPVNGSVLDGNSTGDNLKGDNENASGGESRKIIFFVLVIIILLIIFVVSVLIFIRISKHKKESMYSKSYI
jgi:parallel beta-helix repeat protein